MKQTRFPQDGHVYPVITDRTKDRRYLAKPSVSIFRRNGCILGYTMTKPVRSLWLLPIMTTYWLPRYHHNMAAASAFQPLLVQTLTHIRQRHSFSTTQLFRAKPRKSKTSSEFRADRVMANRTGEPRAHCFELLQKKRVFLKKEDDSFEVIPGPASRIPMNSPLFVDKRHPVPQPVTLLTVFHKPKWMLSVRADPQGRNCLGDLLLPKHPVGRLDYDSSGLLLFSSSGPLTQFLLHPKHGIEKEYVAICTGNIDGDYLHERLSQGVETAEGCYTADLLHVKHLDDVEDYLREVRESLPPNTIKPIYLDGDISKYLRPLNYHWFD